MSAQLACYDEDVPVEGTFRVELEGESGPVEVAIVRDDAGGSARRLLPDRFQEAVDAAAMVAGLIGSDDYTEQMAMDRSQVGDDLEAEAAAAEQAVLDEWSEDQLKVAIRAGGYQGGDDVAGESDAIRPSQD